MIHYTDNNFHEFTKNPYCNNLPYDHSWILLQLIKNAEYLSYTGNNGNGIFRFILTKKMKDWRFCVMDFLEYETFHHKNIIAAVSSADLKEAQAAYAGHCCTDSFLRDYEAPVLVHSTTPQAYKQIIDSGKLKSWNMLSREKETDEELPIGALLGDPYDYRDYIMFHNGGYFSETVVASKEKGKIEMNIHAPYKAGARFYFDAQKIAQDGLLVRDGAHLKVRESLDIEQYLLWIATPEKVDLPGITTPFEFGTKSDKVFQNKFNDKRLSL